MVLVQVFWWRNEINVSCLLLYPDPRVHVTVDSPAACSLAGGGT